MAKTIDKFSWRYALLRGYVYFILRIIFYRKVYIRFEEPLPENTPLIFAPNHQNALMDALLIICSVKKQVVFYARADIFKNKFIAALLTFLKIAPIYRLRDGAENLQQNYTTFSTASGILARNNAIAMFPEARHNDREQLLPLKKGLARIAFQAEAEHNFGLHLQIVPVAMSYSDYIRPRSAVVMQFCKPISIADFKTHFEENPSAAYAALNKAIELALTKRIIHIEISERYSTIQNIRLMYENSYADLSVSFEQKLILSKEFTDNFQKKISENCPHAQQLIHSASLYFKQIEQLGISDTEIVQFKKSKLGISALFLALFAGICTFFAAVIFYFPLIVPYRFINKKIADTQFRSSVYFALISLVVLPVFFLLFVILIIITGWLWLIPLLIASLTVGWLSVLYRKNIVQLLSILKMKRKICRKQVNISELYRMRDEINLLISKMNDLQ